jgi:hypothetical protein
MKVWGTEMSGEGGLIYLRTDSAWELGQYDVCHACRPVPIHVHSSPELERDNRVGLGESGPLKSFPHIHLSKAGQKHRATDDHPLNRPTAAAAGRRIGAHRRSWPRSSGRQMLEIQTRQRSVHHHLIPRQMSCLAVMTRGNGNRAAVATPGLHSHHLHHRDSRTDDGWRASAVTPTTGQAQEETVSICSYACGVNP